MKRLSAVLAILTLGACQSMSDVVEERSQGGGTSEIYEATADQAWEVSRTILRWNGADAIEEHKGQGYMLTSTSAGLFTMGTVMGVWVEMADPEHAKVSVITKRRVATNMITDLTESGFHSDFRIALPIIRNGNPLPLKRPVVEAPARTSK